MGALKIKAEKLNQKASIIKEVLAHFDCHEKKYARDTIQRIGAAANNAFSDEILFEEFENWALNRDDEAFIYLINHYWFTANKPSLGVKAVAEDK